MTAYFNRASRVVFRVFRDAGLRALHGSHVLGGRVAIPDGRCRVRATVPVGA